MAYSSCLGLQRRVFVKPIPGSTVNCVDLTGTKDHFRMEVVAQQFSGKTRLEQHRMVQEIVQAAIDDQRIHALSITTTVPKGDE